MRERYKEGSLRTAKNILSVIEKAKDNDELILVFPHRSVDGDCVGSSSGIVSIVRSLGVDAYVAIPEALPENMEFLGISEYLFRPDGGCAVDDLALQIGKIHRIIVGDADGPYTGSG